MSDHFVSDLTTRFKNVTMSRKRALQIIGGALAVAAPARMPQVAEAGDSPLAVASVALVDVQPSSGGTFTWVIKGAVVVKDSGLQARLDTSAGVDATVTGDRARKEFVSFVRLRASEALKAQQGLTVPRDRIAVTLL